MGFFFQDVSYICIAMQVHYDLKNLPVFRRAVITIGSFDGVHVGHQKIIEKVKQLAQADGGESILITFHPHPRLVIYPKDKDLQLLTTIDEKVQTLKKFGLDHVVVVPFSVEFSQQSADEYIEQFLVRKFNPRHVVVGYDHRFGLNRQGDLDYLIHHGKEKGFEVVEIPKQQIEDISISSTKIRNALAASDIQKANALLGHRFVLTGTVVHGQQIGKKLGFPTANLEVNSLHKLIPPTGIYAVRVRHRGREYGGMLYIGKRPSLKAYNNRTIEVNIFDFSQEIYGDKLQLELVQHIRQDRAFENLQALSKQLAVDRRDALAALEEEAASQAVGPVEKQGDFPSVAVVILNYNGRDFLADFLPRVRRSNYPNLQVIVADNGSTDDSLAFLQNRYPGLTHIDLQQNYGFAEGYNRALAHIEADYYVLLNSDVETTESWLDPIIELMERDPSIAACQPKVRSYHQREYFEYAGASGGWIDYLGYPFCRGRIFATTEKDTGQYDKTQEIFWASGAAMVIRGRLFHSIGGFDPDYFAHAEEIDLCWRLKRAGYKIMVRPQSVVYHVGGGTLHYNTPRKTYLNFRNTLFNVFKNEPRKKLFWLLPLRLVLDGMASCLFLVQGRWRHIGAIVRAHWNFFSSVGKMRKKRRYYKDLIDKVSISEEPNLKAQYPKSIVWKYYARGVRSFREL